MALFLSTGVLLVNISTEDAFYHACIYARYTSTFVRSSNMTQADANKLSDGRSVPVLPASGRRQSPSTARGCAPLLSGSRWTCWRCRVRAWRSSSTRAMFFWLLTLDWWGSRRAQVAAESSIDSDTNAPHLRNLPFHSNSSLHSTDSILDTTTACSRTSNILHNVICSCLGTCTSHLTITPGTTDRISSTSANIKTITRITHLIKHARCCRAVLQAQ
jgi:hypothetical protein